MFHVEFFQTIFLYALEIVHTQSTSKFKHKIRSDNIKAT